jgi:malic enzyme
VEKECQARCNIPVFHDDQHGTAIIAGAGEEAGEGGRRRGSG